MNPPYLLIDVSYLAYQSLYALGDLSYDGVETGVVFGVFRSVMDLVDLFSTNRICWCFDRGHDGRDAIDSTYKANRSDDGNEELMEAKRGVRLQLFRLRTKYLQQIGFQNIFFHDGYEADDCIASICNDLPPGEQAIIVSPDNDLFQLLVQGRVSIWNPASKKSVTANSFQKEWGIGPSQWADVKAISGCTSDNVKGIKGVGEKGACQFLAGTLKATTKKFKAIIENNAVWKHNLPLVRLPFPGIKHFQLQDDVLVPEKWEQVALDLGMKSLLGRSFRVR